MIDGEDVREARDIVPSVNLGTSPKSSGCLTALRTKAEVDARLELREAYVVGAPARSTAAILKVIDNALPATDRAAFAHLRRVIRRENLPVSFQRGHFTTPQPCSTHEQTDAEWKDKTPISVEEPSRSSETLHLFLLLCVTSSMPYGAISALLQDSGEIDSRDFSTNVFTTALPISPPRSAEEARQWSQDYWPAVYKKHNPLGPQSSMISQATREITIDVQRFMALAELTGYDACSEGLGENVGALIVDRSVQKAASVIVAAGDARWEGISGPSKPGNGNAQAHAVMRAIDLVAQKRKGHSFGSNICQPEIQQSGNVPLTVSEKKIYGQSSIDASGYLCLDLELYVTHEPCVMCCMAMLHSRFSRVIFSARMPHTGGLVAEEYEHEGIAGLGYGLFWRPSLNWKFLAWQYDEKGGSRSKICCEVWHA